MPAGQRLHQAFTRVTGLHVARGRPGEPRPEDLERIRALRKRVKRLERTVERSKAAAKPRVKTFPPDFDDDHREIIEAVRPYTMTGNDKLHALIGAVKYVTRYNVPGDILECGVWRGGSMQAAARTLARLGDTSRVLWLFDTFEGMPPPTEHDVRHDGTAAEKLLAANERDASVWAVASLDEVKEGFAGVPYPADKIRFVVGTVEDTIPREAPAQISILRLDTDWYESTAHELEHLYDRLSPGGVLMIDDYGHWAGARKATEEFLDRTGEPLLFIRMNTGRVAVKPWR